MNGNYKECLSRLASFYYTLLSLSETFPTSYSGLASSNFSSFCSFFSLLFHFLTLHLIPKIFFFSSFIDILLIFSACSLPVSSLTFKILVFPFFALSFYYLLMVFLVPLASKTQRPQSQRKNFGCLSPHDIIS